MKKVSVVVLSFLFLHGISLNGSGSPKSANAATLDLSSWVSVSFDSGQPTAAGAAAAETPGAQASSNNTDQNPANDTHSRSPAQSPRGNSQALQLNATADVGLTGASAARQLSPLAMPPLTPTHKLATTPVLESNPTTATPSATPHAAQPQIAAPLAAVAPLPLTAARANLTVPQLTRTKSGRALDAAAAAATNSPTTIVHGSPKDVDLEAQKQSSESAFTRCLRFLSTCCSSCPPCPPSCKAKD